MLLNNVRPDDDDCFYFLYRLVLRSWFLFLAVIFSFPIAALFGRTFVGAQFLTMLVDFLSVWIKAYSIYKEQERIDW